MDSNLAIARVYKSTDSEGTKVNNVKHHYSVQVRELKDGMSLDEAAELTKNNGLDEIFFEQEGKRFVATSPNPQALSDVDKWKSDADTRGMTLNDKPISILKLNDETNSFFGGAWDMTKLIAKTAVVKPYQLLKPYLPNAATAATFVAGVGLGALTRAGDIATTTRIGLAIGAAGGVGTVRAMTDKGSPTAKTLKGAATGIASVALGAVAPEAVKLLAKLTVPEIISHSFKFAATAAVVGSSIAIVGAGIATATREPDWDSLNQIAK